MIRSCSLTHNVSSGLLSDPVSVDLDQYDPVSLTDALRGFLQDLPTPVYSELLHTAQGERSLQHTSN